MPDATFNLATGALGRKIASYRGRRCLSQRDLALLVGRSESWVSQVERGVRQIDRMSVLRSVATALHAPLSELVADTPLAEPFVYHHDQPSCLRMMLSEGPRFRPAEAVPDGADGALADEARLAWGLAPEARYEELPELLVSLLPRLEAAAAADGLARAGSTLAKTYFVCATALSRQHDPNSAWLAADRGIAAAERSGDRARMAEGAVYLAEVFLDGGRHAQAEYVADNAIQRILEHAESQCDARVGAIMALLWLRLAVVAAKRGEPAECRAAIDRATRLVPAEVDGDDGYLRARPSDVQLCLVRTAVELGSPERALRAAAAVPATQLSRAQTVDLKFDLARAYLQRQDTSGALRAILEAEHVAPRYVRNHPWTRSTMRYLLREARAVGPSLAGLARRCNLPTPTQAASA